jgi:DNA-binding protein
MDRNSVYIGSKPLMNYVLAIVTQFNAAKVENVVVKARGRAISTAVDVVEVTKNRFLPNIVYKDIRLGTEVVTREDGSQTNVSSFEIELNLKQPSVKKEKKPAEKKTEEEKPVEKKTEEEKPVEKKD